MQDLLRFCHHHLAELVKVHGSGPVLVQLLDDVEAWQLWQLDDSLVTAYLDDAVQLLVTQGGQQLADQRPQGVVGDEAETLSVVDS